MSTGEPIIASSHKGDATQLSFDQAQTTKRVNTASGNTRLDDTESTIDEVIRHRPYGFPQFLTDLAATTTTPISQSLHERTSNFGPGLLGLSPASISLGISSVTTHAATNVPATSTGTSATKRLYRAGENKWVTRDIASLDFLLGIPLAAEQDIVTTGWRLQLQREDEDDTSSHSSSNRNRSELNTDYDKGIPSTAKGTWWEKWVQPENMKLDSAIHRTTKKNKINESEAAELEQPTEADTGATFAQMSTNMNPAAIGLSYAPGRRLEGDEAVRIHIPLTFDNTITKQRSIARQANLRQWELQTAHGLAKCGAAPPMLDGRLFFSANSGYPISVFSVIRYEPKKEEAAIRRRKLEAVGGGGSQFVLPNRDWRGISYRALLRRGGDDGKVDRKFNRFVQGRAVDGGETSDDSSTSSMSSEDSDVYVPGLLDDPGMVLGRHRTVMIGDRVTGPIVSSTIQFVKPALLKAELNKQFRERFDGWEPPKRARKFIGAKVIQGNYVLMDPTEEYDEQSFERRRNRQGSISTASVGSDEPKEKTIRMPPSLTLSKIRSLKSQVLQAAVRANLEIGTVALACVYFERLCLDCRVDKSNRRLAFAACLLLAAKLNEPNVGLVMRQQEDAENDTDKPRRFQSLIRPNKTSTKMFASLLLFFTQDWSLSLIHLFTAEWGVFAALGFSLDATPIQIAFHFKRLMKALEWSPLDYLGSAMYNHWQDALVDEEQRRDKRERRDEAKRKQKEERLLNLHYEIENEVLRRKAERHVSESNEEIHEDPLEFSPPKSPMKTGATERRLKLFNRFASRRSVSTDRLEERGPAETTDLPEQQHQRSGSMGRLYHSPSMPSMSNYVSSAGSLVISIPDINNDSDASSIGALQDGNGIVI